MRNKTVVVRVSVEVAIEVPEHWQADTVNFARNESTWCKSNAKAWFDSLFARDCVCGLMEIEYLREATVEDEQQLLVVDCGNLKAPTPEPEDGA